MLTGRRPTNESFEEVQNLHKFVQVSFPNNLLQILDHTLYQEMKKQQEEKTKLNFIQVPRSALYHFLGWDLLAQWNHQEKG